MSNSKNLNQIITYQKDSVVSKEIISKPSGTITLFAFDGGQGLSEHSAPYDVFIFVTDGSVGITVSDVQNEIKAGESLVLPADVPHSLKAIKPSKLLLVMMKS